MPSRGLILATYAVAVLSLAAAFRLPVGVSDLALALMVPVTLWRRPKLWVRAILILALAAVAVWCLPSPATVVVAGLMAVAALAMTRAYAPSPIRYLVVALGLTTWAALMRTELAWTYLPVAALAIASLVTDAEVSAAVNQRRLRLAGTLAGLTALAALLGAVVLRAFPWRTVLATLLTLAAYPFLWLLSRLPLPHLTSHPHALTPTRLAIPHLTHVKATHAPWWLFALAFVLGAALLAGLLVAAYRYWARHAEESASAGVPDENIVHIPLSPEEVAAQTLRERLGPARRFVRARLQAAARRGRPRAAHETLREWLRRQSSESAAEEAAKLYDAIRYGQQPDTPARKEALKQAWPPEAPSSRSDA
ncbi:MAG: DUF4129 domain-containing protein [Firmicutes bacterium]|nr:DUF4129 domain-containing protein [Bacillota bacterium]